MATERHIVKIDGKTYDWSTAMADPVLKARYTYLADDPNGIRIQGMEKALSEGIEKGTSLADQESLRKQIQAEKDRQAGYSSEVKSPVDFSQVTAPEDTYGDVNKNAKWRLGESNISNTKQTTQPTGFTLTSGNLKQGVYNNQDVRQLQTLLGITADGDFGPQTKAAVIAFQKANGLTPDGIVGPKTASALAKLGQPVTSSGGLGASDLTSRIDQSSGTSSTSATGTSASARKEIEKIKSELERGTDKPETYDSLEEYDKLRKEQGIVNDENELNAIQNESRLAQEELRVFKSKNAREISQGGFTGAVSEAERNLNFRLEGLAIREQAVVSRINTKNSYINTALQLGEKDYNRAYQEYTDEYNKNLKAIDMYNEDLDDQKKDALTSFQTLTNLITESGMTITPQLSQQLDTLALQVGLPSGVFQQAVGGLSLSEKIKNTEIRDDGLYMWTTDANGNPHLKLIQSLSSGSGLGGKTYTIKSGDTLNAIANRLGLTVDSLRSLNPGINENNLQIGQKLNTDTTKLVSTTGINQSADERQLESLFKQYGITSQEDFAAKSKDIPFNDLMKIVDLLP